MLLIASLVVFAVPAGAEAAAKGTCKYYYDEYLHTRRGVDVTAYNAKGEVIKPGASVPGGSQIRFIVTPLEGYEITDESVIYFYTYDSEDSDYYNDYQDLYFDEDNSTPFITVPNKGVFVINAYGTMTFDLKIKADKHVKSIVIGSPEGDINNTLPVGQTSYVINKATGLSGGYIRVGCVFEDGYELGSVGDEEGCYAYEYNTDGSAKVSIYGMYDDDAGDTVNKAVLSITSKKAGSKKAEKYKTTAVATYKKSFSDDSECYGTVTIKSGKKVLGKMTVYESYYYNYHSVYWEEGAEFNAKNAKKVEQIDLSGLKGLCKLDFEYMVDILNREYHKGNLPALKAICLPKNIPFGITDPWDGYMRYYPLNIYNAK